MKMMSIKKSKFYKIKDKIYYFPNVILSLPFGHSLLNKTRETKKQIYKRNTQSYCRN